MSYRVSVKPGHPTGSRRRSGQVFTGVPVEVESVTDEMRADPWLQIVEIPSPSLTDAERAAKEAAEREAAEREAADARAKQEAEENARQQQQEGDAATEQGGGDGAEDLSRASRKSRR